MGFRAVLFTVGLLGAGSVGLTLSCTAPDPGEVTFIERKPTGIEQTGSGGDPSSSSSSSTSSTTSSSGDASTTSSTGGPPTDAFAGAPAFVAPATPTAMSNNANHGVNQNPAGRDCISCHNGQGAAPAWGFAGTVYDNAGTAVPGIEVRALDKTGKAGKIVYTDLNGNFWSDDPAFVPAKMGIRDATRKMQMSSLLDATKGDISCQRSTCHNTANQAKITIN